MKSILIFAVAVIIAILLAACSPSISEGIGHRITFNDHGMTVHAFGKPDARIGSDGSLAIGGKAVAVTPVQRALLQRYYGEARGTLHSGGAIARAGVGIAEHAIAEAVDNLLGTQSGAADKTTDGQSKAIDKATMAMCIDIEQMAATQSQVAAQLPALKPYAAGALANVHCTTTTTRSTRANGKPQSSTTLNLTIQSSATP